MEERDSIGLWVRVQRILDSYDIEVTVPTIIQLWNLISDKPKHPFDKEGISLFANNQIDLEEYVTRELGIDFDCEV
jgi:hypothetical protein